MTVDYDRLIHLDAEELAEQGIGEAYEELKPRLAELGVASESVEEIDNVDLPSYEVRFRGERYHVESGASDPGEELWSRATFAFFHIVNLQLRDTPYRFYAVDGGNELSGVFLTEQEYQEWVSEIPRATDRPYIPTLDSPWFGQSHD